jgi:hypothetical protein
MYVSNGKAKIHPALALRPSRSIVLEIYMQILYLDFEITKEVLATSKLDVLHFIFVIVFQNKGQNNVSSIVSSKPSYYRSSNT